MQKIWHSFILPLKPHTHTQHSHLRFRNSELYSISFRSLLLRSKIESRARRDQGSRLAIPRVLSGLSYYCCFFKKMSLESCIWTKIRVFEMIFKRKENLLVVNDIYIYKLLGGVEGRCSIFQMSFQPYSPLSFLYIWNTAVTSGIALARNVGD